MTFTHGASGYNNHLCRCDVCREGHAAYQKGWRRQRQDQLAWDSTLAEHGTQCTYTNWGCRCQRCRDAHTEADRHYRASQAGAT